METSERQTVPKEVGISVYPSYQDIKKAWNYLVPKRLDLAMKQFEEDIV